MTKKKVTNENLAAMIKTGFDEVTNKLGTHDKKFAELEQGQEDIKLKLDRTASDFDVTDHEKRIKKLEKAVGI